MIFGAMGQDPSIPRARLLPLLDRVDAFDAIGAMLFASFAGCPPPANGRQPHVAGAFGCEYAVMELLRRGTVAPRVVEGEPVLVEDLVTWVEAAASAETVHDFDGLEAGDPTGMETNAHRRFTMHQIMVYDAVVPELEAQRWPQLFVSEEEALERVTGLTIEAIQRMTTTFLLFTTEWCLHHAQVDDDALDGTNYFAVLRAAVARGRAWEVEPGSGLLLTTTREQLSLTANVSLEQVDRFLALFAVRPGPDAVAPFRRFVWELRRRPLVEWDGRIILPVPLHLTTALRPTLETALRNGDAAAGSRYDSHKGKWVEREALRLLSEALEPEQAYRTLKVPAEASGLTDPERDGLLRVDLVAFAVEAKGGGVALAARRGNADSQDKVFDRLIHEGVAQADDLIAALRQGAEVTGIDLESDQRVPVDIGYIRRWVPLVVTLEDMSGVVAAYEATFADREQHRPHPIVLTLDDIAWMSRELPLPAQLVHYMIVRERIARSAARIIMYDETDWFGLYYAAGAAHVQERLDQFAAIDAPVLTGGGSGRRGALDRSLTAWETPFAPALERWRAERIDGWLAASMAVLDLSAQQAAELRAGIAPARRQAIEADDTALFTIVPRGDPSVALQVLVPGGECELALDDYSALFADGAPDALEHTFLVALDDELEDLQLLGVGGVVGPGAPPRGPA